MGRRLKIVSFSGIDGAGKSTQISSLNSYLQECGYRTVLLTFWDNVVVWRRLREAASRKAFGGDQGIGSPQRPLNRRDKNVQSWFLTAIRYVFYLADAISLRRVVAKIEESESDVVIFDRYIYDELANLQLGGWFPRAFTRLVLMISPHPDTAFLIDADPETARARKPEYPLDFLRRNRDAYIVLGKLCADVTFVEPMGIEAMEGRLRAEVSRVFRFENDDLVRLAALP
jgi:thymidylate kinase